MLEKKKGAGLAVTIIIVAVMGLIALFILVNIFGEETGRSVKILNSCEAKGGQCVLPFECKDNSQSVGRVDCEPEKYADEYGAYETEKVCCVGI